LKQQFRKQLFATFSGLILLGIFIGWNYILHLNSQQNNSNQVIMNEREHIPEKSGLTPIRLAYYDFESGDIANPDLHLSASGHQSNQSMKLDLRVPFSPGLWIQFKDLTHSDSSWIRASGYIWFSCPVSEVKCSLVATCNHKGINYKYMFIPLEKEDVKPNQWNKINIDYHIPPAPDKEDVLQAYFWYRGKGEILVDEIEVTFFRKSEIVK